MGSPASLQTMTKAFCGFVTTLNSSYGYFLRLLGMSSHNSRITDTPEDLFLPLSSSHQAKYSETACGIFGHVLLRVVSTYMFMIHSRVRSESEITQLCVCWRYPLISSNNVIFVLDPVKNFAFLQMHAPKTLLTY